MTLPFDVDYTGHHVPHIQRYDVPSNRTNMTMMITLFFLILLHSHRCFQTHINFLQDFFRHVINTATIKNFTEISLQLPWRLQNTGQWQVNMLSGMLLSPHFTFLGRRPRPYYPRHSLRMHLHNFLLDSYQPHTILTI